jgi:hypothetical protein
MNLVSSVAKEKDIAMPILSLLLDRFASARAKGRGGMDWSAVSFAAAEDSGLDVESDIARNAQHVRDDKKYYD